MDQEIKETEYVKLEGVDYDPPFNEKDETRDALDPVFEEDEQDYPSSDLPPVRDTGFIDGGKGPGRRLILFKGRYLRTQKSPTAVRIIIDEKAASDEQLYMQRVRHGEATASSTKRYILREPRTPTLNQIEQTARGQVPARRNVIHLTQEANKARLMALRNKGQIVPVFTS